MNLKTHMRWKEIGLFLTILPILLGFLLFIHHDYRHDQILICSLDGVKNEKLRAGGISGKDGYYLSTLQESYTPKGGEICYVTDILKNHP